MRGRWPQNGRMKRVQVVEECEPEQPPTTDDPRSTASDPRSHAHDNEARSTTHEHAHELELEHEHDEDQRHAIGPFPHEKLDVYRVALEMAGLAKELAKEIPRGHRHVADHLQRAADGTR